MHPQDRLALERLVVDNPDLEALETRIARFNLFEAAGLVRHEIRHSNLLAFLLDPSQPHSLGDAFLKGLLQETLGRADAQALHALSPLDLHLRDLTGSVVRREWRNIDLLVENAELGLLVAIENKIGTGEHSDQLARYRDTLRREFPDARHVVLILLSPQATAPTHEAYLPLGYETIHALLAKTLDRLGPQLGPDVSLVLRHYKELLATHVIEDPELDKLCDAIYRKHKKALDLIFERRSRAFDVVANTVQSWIREREAEVVPNQMQNVYISFVPKSWLSFSHLVSVGNEKPRYSLAVLFTNNATNGRISLEVYGVDKEAQARFRKIAEDSAKAFPGLSKVKGDKFTTLYSVRHLSRADYADGDSEALSQKVQNALDDYMLNVLPLQTEAFQKGLLARVEP